MRKYEKPVMQVERYEAKNAVATGCFEETSTVFPAQTVNCIINGSENIFDKDQTGSSCQYDASYGKLGVYTGATQTFYYTENRQTKSITLTNGAYYFIWFNDTVKGQVGDQTAALTALEQNLGGGKVDQMGWHAGQVTTAQYKAMNSTS